MPDFGIMRGFNDKLFGDKLYAGQLPTQLGLIGSSDFEFDPDAQAFFDRVTAASGSLSATERLAVDTLVRQMKADGIWNSMKAIYPMVGASAAACAQNLKSSSFTGTFSSGWTFASTGVRGNTSSTYFNTELLASTNLSISSAHISSYVNIIGNQAVLMGINDLSGFLQPQSGNLYGSLATSSITAGLTSTVAAFYLVNRTSLTTQKVIKNASIILSESKTGSAFVSAQNFFIGAYGVSSLVSDARFAFCSIGDGLTDTQASNFYTAVQAMQVTLSRSV
jgi:hypothetical protein